jgi:uncharacterized membrane protein YhiD involved in acid resistance
MEEEILKDLKELPNKIKEAEIATFTTALGLEALEQLRVSIELSTTSIVINEHDDSGKKMYTNEDSRRAAVSETLSHNEEYIKIMTSILDLKKQQIQNKTDLDYYNNKFRAARSMVTLIKGEVS